MIGWGGVRLGKGRSRDESKRFVGLKRMLSFTSKSTKENFITFVTRMCQKNTLELPLS